MADSNEKKPSKKNNKKQNTTLKGKKTKNNSKQKVKKNVKKETVTPKVKKDQPVNVVIENNNNQESNKKQNKGELDNKKNEVVTEIKKTEHPKAVTTQQEITTPPSEKDFRFALAEEKNKDTLKDNVHSSIEQNYSATYSYQTTKVEKTGVFYKIKKFFKNIF